MWAQLSTRHISQFLPYVQQYVSANFCLSSSSMFLQCRQRCSHWENINYVLHITPQERITWREICRPGGGGWWHGNRRTHSSLQVSIYSILKLIKHLDLPCILQFIQKKINAAYMYDFYDNLIKKIMPSFNCTLIFYLFIVCIKNTFPSYFYNDSIEITHLLIIYFLYVQENIQFFLLLFLHFK